MASVSINPYDTDDNISSKYIICQELSRVGITPNLPLLAVQLKRRLCSYRFAVRTNQKEKRNEENVKRMKIALHGRLAYTGRISGNSGARQGGGFAGV
jgi:hypothetical protein